MKKPTIDEYIQALEKMKESPGDRIGILGELGVTGLGVTAGVALSGTVAGAAGAATLAGSTTLASILGGIFVTTTPIGWVVGAAFTGGVLAYTASQMIRSGEKCDIYKTETIKELENRVKILRNEAEDSSLHEEKMKKIITSLQFLVANTIVTQEKSTELLAAIELRILSIDDAFDLVEELLKENR